MPGETETAPRPIVCGWAILETRKVYGVAYGLEWLIGLVVSPITPPSPDIIYVLQNTSTGETRKVRLPGDSVANALELVTASWNAASKA